MSDQPDDPLIALAASIDADRPIEWDTAEQSARDGSERLVVSQLRVLAAITGVFRDPDAAFLSTRSGSAQPTPVQEASASWGPLKVFEAIGTGAFGTVYRGADGLDRQVALKLFGDGPERSDQRERVLREGRMLARVRHPNVVTVYGADEFDGRVGLWMELIRGRTLEDELRSRGVFSAEEARDIGLHLCRALAAVHQAGLVHRDVKAQNVVREVGGRIVLMDFGAGTDAQLEDGVPDIAGTPAYLAPEVFAGQPSSRASDIYGLGVLLYHLVTASYPVAGTNRGEIQRSHREGRRKRLRDARPDLPGEFVKIVEAAIEPDPRQRYQTAGEFEHALLSSRGSEPPQPVPPALRPAPGSPVAQWLMRGALLAAAVILAMVVVRYANFWRQAEPSVPAAPDPLLRTEPGGYTVSATFYRFNGRNRAPLAPGDRISPGDTLGLGLEASVPVFTYVVNEDDRGESYLLFPLPGRESENPLGPGKVHELPGAGQHWQVTSAGGHEHFLIFVSPSHLSVFDGLLKSLPSPVAGRPLSQPRLPDSTLSRLRGVGGLVAQNPNGGSSSAHYLFEGAVPLEPNAVSAHDVWVRQLTLDNPSH